MREEERKKKAAHKNGNNKIAQYIRQKNVFESHSHYSVIIDSVSPLLRDHTASTLAPLTALSNSHAVRYGSLLSVLLLLCQRVRLCRRSILQYQSFLQLAQTHERRKTRVTHVQEHSRAQDSPKQEVL